ncbi:MAG: RHS repeat-associated core domain-containing protein [Bacteroidota bacterium]
MTGYNYDALGRRITKVVNGNILKYSYSGVAQIEERNSSNTLLNRTVFTGFLTPVLNERNGNAYYYHQNEHNSVEAISNSSGRLVERYEYDAYGKLSRYDSLNNPLSSSIAGNRFGFTGQEYDSATGSYRFYFRNYSPETGVFNQRDLIEYGDATGMYQYVGNNPANGIDIWGLEKKDCKKNGRDLLADFDTFSDSKTFLEFADISLPGPAGAVVNVVTFPVDMYKTANSINKMSEVKVDYNNPDKVPCKILLICIICMVVMLLRTEQMQPSAQRR